MKHSKPVRFPTSFMIVAISLVTLGAFFVGYRLYQVNLKSVISAEDSNSVVVEQLNYFSFQKAINYIQSNK